MRTVLLFFILCIILASNSLAQTSDSTLVKIETVDGNEFVGKIVSEETAKIVLETEKFGTVTIQKSDIKTQSEITVTQIKNGKLWFSNPQATRYFWAPNSYGLKNGEGYYQNIYVLWNQFSIGVTDNLSLGAGVIPLFLFGGAPTPVFATAKISIPIKKDIINVGGGAIIGTVLGEDVGGFGIVYGVSTFGSRDNNVTLGLGYGFADGEFAKSPLINLSGLFRISSRGYFITENYYLGVSDFGGGIISVGGRWIIKKASLDFLLAIPYSSDMDAFIAFPIIGFSIPFGNK
ncbi:MAG: hypothetical protein JXR61_08225 [Prolixibacteraceae bacterium]|nr:hypothetical protein [Prolixibacteraceae bacterium]